METCVTAVEMAEKSRVSVAWTRISTLRSASREFLKPTRLLLTCVPLGRAGTENSVVTPEAEMSVMVNQTVPSESSSL